MRIVFYRWHHRDSFCLYHLPRAWDHVSCFYHVAVFQRKQTAGTCEHAEHPVVTSVSRAHCWLYRTRDCGCSYTSQISGPVWGCCFQSVCRLEEYSIVSTFQRSYDHPPEWRQQYGSLPSWGKATAHVGASSSPSKLSCCLIHALLSAEEIMRSLSPKGQHVTTPCLLVTAGVQAKVNTRWHTSNYHVHKTKGAISLAALYSD